MISAHPRKRIRWATRSALAAWTALILADTIAVLGIWPWMPAQPHTLAVGICITASCAALLMRVKIPVEAAMLHGMLTERANPGTLRGVDSLPMASGDDTGGATVHQFARKDSGGRHARHDRPAPRPRRP